MKKTGYFLWCGLGLVLLASAASAEESRFSGDIYLGGSVVSGRLSPLDAEEGDETIDGLDKNNEDETFAAPLIGGELRYALDDRNTVLFLTDSKDGEGLALGLRALLPDSGQIAIAATFAENQVWEDPYITGTKRRRTDALAYGVTLDYEGILGSGFLLSAGIARVEVDKDLIGKREKALRREGYRSHLELGYAMQIDDHHQIIPSLRYERGDLEGDANSSDGYGWSLAYHWVGGPLEFTASVGMGWNIYREDHPVFAKARKAKHYTAFALVNYHEPFGWSRVSIFSLAGYDGIDENIDFFDGHTWTAGLGLGYHF